MSTKRDEIFLKGSVAVWVFLFSESVHSMSGSVSVYEPVFIWDEQKCFFKKRKDCNIWNIYTFEIRTCNVLRGIQ